jgi:S-DNA-T family DNA segregation ATPase FtsK/SpoIIIE
VNRLLTILKETRGMIDKKYFSCFNYSTKNNENVIEKEKFEKIFKNKFFMNADVKCIYSWTEATRYDVEVPVENLNILKHKTQEFNYIFRTKGCKISTEGNLLHIKVPQKEKGIYRFADCLEALDKIENYKDGLFISIGEALDGSTITYDLAAMPHFLIGGQSGSEKSMFAHNVVLSLLLQYSKEELNLLLIDPKTVEFEVYNGVPQVSSVITENKEAYEQISLLCDVMDSRYELFSQYQCRDIAEYNAVAKEKLPRIVVFVEELSDLVQPYGDKIIDVISRLASKGRATGIHVILSTKNAGLDVLPRNLVCNIQCRVGFTTIDRLNSRMILGSNGAELLRGHGDGLFRSNNGQQLTRFQAPCITKDEIKQAVNLLKIE